MVLAIYEAVSVPKKRVFGIADLYISKKKKCFYIFNHCNMHGGISIYTCVSKGGSTYKTIIVLVSVIAVTFFLLLFSYHNNSQSSEKNVGTNLTQSLTILYG